MLRPRVPLRRLEKSILAFEEEPVVRSMILFYGSSTFTRWREKYHNPNLEDVIRMKDGSQACVNHGFGSSTAEEQLYYYPRAVRPWEPRALVLYAFGNDYGFGYSPAEVLSLQTRIMEYARADNPDVRLFLCTSRPTLKDLELPEREILLIDEYNDLVRAYCALHPDVGLVDHSKCAGFYADGRVGEREALRPEIFVADKVHNNAEGYEVYRNFIADILKDLL